MDRQSDVSKLYNSSVLKEWTRLVQDPFHELEFQTTMHFLEQYLPSEGLILDAGGGPGRYTIELAKRGYKMVLFDLSEGLLTKAREEIKKAGVEGNVQLIKQGSITDLSDFESESFDAVLCLGGPLSHVEGEGNREKAVRELTRVAKKDSIVALSVIGRLAIIIMCMKYWPEEIKDTRHFKKLWKTGDDYRFVGDFFAHHFLAIELDKLVKSTNFEVLMRVGLEGIGSFFADDLNKFAKDYPDAYKYWFEAHLELCTNPSVYETSSHMLIVGRKK